MHTLLTRLFVLFFLEDSGWLTELCDSALMVRQMSQKYQGDGSLYRAIFLPLCHSLQSHLCSRIPEAPFHSLLVLFRPNSIEDQCIVTDALLLQLHQLCTAYRWKLTVGHDVQVDELDTQILSALFEQQSDQKAQGTYYTPDDVSGYLVHKTLLPHLLQLFLQSASQFHILCGRLLTQQPERYIPAALQSPQRLPEESEHEYQARQQRCHRLITLLQAQKLAHIDELVTCNLDLLQMTLDLLQRLTDPAELLCFYALLEQLSILDPTCGCGAFLLSALNTLEVLYTACLERLFSLPQPEDLTVLNHYMTLCALLEQAPNQTYFIRSQIIAHNLYGVDLDSEAVQLCRLRLSLLLLAGLPPCTTITRSDVCLERILVGNMLMSKTTTNPPWEQIFAPVIAQGGFSLIVGNPPYIECHNAGQPVEAMNYGNLYAAIIERAVQFSRADNGYIGFIVPLSLCGSGRFEKLRTLLLQQAQQLWLANFEIFPNRLFEGAFQRISICLLHRSRSVTTSRLTVTKVHHWYSAERPFLFSLLNYVPVQDYSPPAAFPKYASSIHQTIISKISKLNTHRTIASALYPHRTPYFVYYQEATNYWLKAICHIPFYKKNGQEMMPPHGRILFFECAQQALTVMALMNSSLFYSWFAAFSDGFHLAHQLVTSFPFPLALFSSGELAHQACQLEEQIQLYAQRSTRNPRVPRTSTTIELTEYHMAPTKPLLDEIDCTLARYYHFTQEELLFLLSYELKYRMGRGSLIHHSIGK
ncbi:hypothetical protein KTT_24890 [Tengunoibacter tsumagoiensis]|uniref:site-specific DNA-methyltransferase (adenine-specific) n=1 Tax=Tengunoibacter tsumagoiensis TaxID=2014871 RepID=A0A402A0F5_9CHLR|nr:hypothetical protein KTT_24890 [Tengunoibacter tsumagoiensis]